MLRNKIKKLIYTTAGRHETQKSELWKWGNKDTSFFFFFHLLETLYDNTAHALYFTNSCKITLIAEESQC